MKYGKQHGGLFRECSDIARDRYGDNAHVITTYGNMGALKPSGYVVVRDGMNLAEARTLTELRRKLQGPTPELVRIWIAGRALALRQDGICRAMAAIRASNEAEEIWPGMACK